MCFVVGHNEDDNQTWKEVCESVLAAVCRVRQQQVFFSVFMLARGVGLPVLYAENFIVI